MLSSFSLGGMTPYAQDDAPNRLFVHRYRSTWSAEGRLDTQGIEDLQLERSWSGHGIACERFGQVGSMPVRGFFPFVALEDREAGVLWGAQIACPGSWQMEVFRKDDFIALSGGQADREFGHWFKTLKAGETYDTPVATIGCIKGDIDQLAQRLSSAQEGSLANLPKIENELPIVVNEWCTSWGNPTQENLLALAKRLQGTPAKYLVIDDGWAERPGGGIQQNGDWIINRKAFPNGLAATCQAIRDHGLIPGIWFEFEVCNPGSKAFSLTDHHLHRDGRVLQVGSRHYWDFRDPFTFDYLTKKVIHLLRDNGLGYLKVDYNETIGFGVDGAESPGEGLRQHLEGMQKFFRKMREEIPDLVIENCSSGGHRLEPSMMGLCAMGSFSDAHETREIPIIAANLQRLILPRQSQIWAVLRKNDTAQRLAYSLAATFLGRMCLSGEVHDLSPAQWKLSVSAMELYRRVYPIIRDGHSTFHGETGKSWRHPQGWQAVLRTSKNGKRALLVAHTFGKAFPKSVQIPLAESGWKIEEAWPEKQGLTATLKGKSIELDLNGEFRASVISLRHS
jgi:alpha-galactosidase